MVIQLSFNCHSIALIVLSGAGCSVLENPKSEIRNPQLISLKRMLDNYYRDFTFQDIK
jgi:hypothetical protein